MHILIKVVYEHEWMGWMDGYHHHMKRESSPELFEKK